MNAGEQDAPRARHTDELDAVRYPDVEAARAEVIAQLRCGELTVPLPARLAPAAVLGELVAGRRNAPQIGKRVRVHVLRILGHAAGVGGIEGLDRRAPVCRDDAGGALDSADGGIRLGADPAVLLIADVAL